MFDIVRYSADMKAAWDGYVGRARNATFLFLRDYMDYHADRFRDHSLLFFAGGRLHSVLPAHEEPDGTFCSHRGLTYGGLLMDENVVTADVVTLFDDLNAYLRSKGFRRVMYRAIPWVYHRLPAEEDLYAMFWRCQARLLQRMSGTVIFMEAGLRWRKDHRRRLRQAQAAGIRVERGGRLEDFWPMLEDNLQRKFATKPVHTLAEMQLLQSRLPERIIQYNAFMPDGSICGGITFYLMGHVLHGQYSATSDAGKQYGAMEAIYDQVMNIDFPRVRYLDFGTSNDGGGAVLCEGLIAHKEGYGGRTVCYDTYGWEL